MELSMSRTQTLQLADAAPYKPGGGDHGHQSHRAQQGTTSLARKPISRSVRPERSSSRQPRLAGAGHRPLEGRQWGAVEIEPDALTHELTSR
jgi:hypothetical protein